MKLFPSSPRLSCLLSALACSFSLIACGGSSGDGGSGTESQTTVDDWRDYCIATFTEEYPVLDGFGDVAFTAHVGDEFLMASYDADDNPQIIFLAETGPETIELEEATLPFTSNCTAGATTQHYAVFSDTTVYAEEELTTSLCELEAGHAVPLEPTGAGYGITGSNAGSGAVYEVILNALSTECGGAERGYVDAPQTVLWGSYTYLVPIQVIVGPA
jgi:hypothetical protein